MHFVSSGRLGSIQFFFLKQLTKVNSLHILKVGCQSLLHIHGVAPKTLQLRLFPIPRSHRLEHGSVLRLEGLSIADAVLNLGQLFGPFSPLHRNFAHLLHVGLLLRRCFLPRDYAIIYWLTEPQLKFTVVSPFLRFQRVLMKEHRIVEIGLLSVSREHGKGRFDFLTRNSILVCGYLCKIINKSIRTVQRPAPLIKQFSFHF